MKPSVVPCRDKGQEIALDLEREIKSMIFVVYLMRGATQSAKPTVIRSVELEADDIFKVVERIRIMLAYRDFYPAVDAFQISLDGKEIIHQEARGSADASESQRKTHSSTSDVLLAG